MQKLPPLFLKGRWYYAKVVVNGIRKTIATHSTDRSEAMEYIANILKKDELVFNEENHDASLWKLADVLRPFTDISTNPKMKDCQFSGSCYGMRHAHNVARSTIVLGNLLKQRAPGILTLPVKKLTRKECKDIGFLILDKFGHTSKAQNIFKSLKTSLSYATDESIIESNPSAGLPDIKVEVVHERIAVPPEDIQAIICHHECFPDELSRDIFILFVTTGMRRSELMALDWSRIQETCGMTVIRIDQAYKDECWKVIGTPKWNKTRVLPASRLAIGALEDVARLHSGQRKGKLFTGYTPKHVIKDFRFIRQMALSAIPDLVDRCAVAQMTPHALRHSLNTNLRLAGMGDLLVAEYLSWQHQDTLAMQREYTHIYARNLVPVAQMIDRIYGQGKIPEGKVLQFHG